MAKLRVFLSYSSADRPIAERIHMALVAAGYAVFFDRESLPAGDNFDVRILEALAQSDLLIFLLSPTSIQAGAYSLTELAFARRQWANPARRVLPVVIRAIDLQALPVYLRPVTLLEPQGDVAAEVVAAVHALRRRGWRWARWAGVALAVLASAGAIGVYTTQLHATTCRFVASDAWTLAQRMRDYARTAAEREQALRDEWEQVEAALNKANMAGDTQGVFAAMEQEHALDERLAAAVHEHNAEMRQLATASQSSRTALVARCVSGGETARGAPAWSVNLEQASAERFQGFVALAEQLDALAARAAPRQP